MIRLVRAELLKLRTTQVWFWMLVAALVLSALVVIGSLADKNAVKTQADLPQVFASTNGALLAVFILGVLGITTEFRYQTITPALLQTPSRWTVVSAKLITYALVGAIYAIVCIAVELAIGVPWISAKGITFSLDDGPLRRALLGLLLVFALFAIVGIGVGALIRSQVVALAVGLVFLLVIQNVVAAIPHVKQAWPYTPGGATTGILFTGHDAVINDVAPLSLGGSVVVLLLWAFVPAVAGAAYSMNRDIT